MLLGLYTAMWIVQMGHVGIATMVAGFLTQRSVWLAHALIVLILAKPKP